jgi:hypothetical protein
MATTPTTRALIHASTAMSRIEEIVVALINSTKGQTLRIKLASVEKLAVDTRSELNQAMASAPPPTDEPHDPALNASDDLKASASALGLCVFLFERIDSVGPDALDYVETINSFVAVGIQLAGAAEDAAYSASDILRRELGHE